MKWGKSNDILAAKKQERIHRQHKETRIMRLRHITGAEQRIAESIHVVSDPEAHRGRWPEVYGNDHPIHVEIGMGKGKFLMELARQNPQINYLGVEIYSSVLLKAVQKQEEEQLPNVRFLCVDALRLADILGPGEAAKIYLNFSDPWPKDRHAKRRLTSPRFLTVYDRILTPDGTVEFKTDNRELFAYSLESVPAAGWEIIYSTFDLHHSEYAEGNVMTEYEEKFAAEGKPICKLVATRRKIE